MKRSEVLWVLWALAIIGSTAVVLAATTPQIYGGRAVCVVHHPKGGSELCANYVKRGRPLDPNGNVTIERR